MTELNIIKSNVIQCSHGFSTRTGGISTGIFSSLNLGIKRGDPNENVIRNWGIFLDALNMPERFVCGNQVHGNRIVVADEKDLRKACEPGNVHETDGFVTNRKNVPLAIFTADCVPVLLHDPVCEVIGAIHCGWRSTVADIEGNAVNAMVSLGARPENIRMAIGPAICGNCFEVGAEVIDAASSLIGKEQLLGLYRQGRAEDKYLLDLKEVVKVRGIQLGLRLENIEIRQECTMCSPEMFWSHRYTGGERGSQASVICMSE